MRPDRTHATSSLVSLCARRETRIELAEGISFRWVMELVIIDIVFWNELLCNSKGKSSSTPSHLEFPFVRRRRRHRWRLKHPFFILFIHNCHPITFRSDSSSWRENKETNIREIHVLSRFSDVLKTTACRWKKENMLQYIQTSIPRHYRVPTKSFFARNIQSHEMKTLPILRWQNEARGRFRLPIQTSNSTIYRPKCRFVKGHRIVERWNAFLLSVDVARRPCTFFCEAWSQRRFKDIVETYRLTIIGTRVSNDWDSIAGKISIRRRRACTVSLSGLNQRKSFDGKHWSEEESWKTMTRSRKWQLCRVIFVPLIVSLPCGFTLLETLYLSNDTGTFHIPNNNVPT